MLELLLAFRDFYFDDESDVRTIRVIEGFYGVNFTIEELAGL